MTGIEALQKLVEGHKVRAPFMTEGASIHLAYIDDPTAGVETVMFVMTSPDNGRKVWGGRVESFFLDQSKEHDWSLVEKESP